MRKIEAVSITTENFAPYGYIANITEPGDAYGLGTAPCVFHRDMVLAPMASTAPVAFGSLKLDPRPMVVEDVEYHSAAVEIMMPLDEDVVMVAGPANDDRVEPALLKAFVVPAGTLVAFRAGDRKNSVEMKDVAAKMTDAEIKAVADYIAGLR